MPIGFCIMSTGRDGVCSGTEECRHAAIFATKSEPRNEQTPEVGDPKEGRNPKGKGQRRKVIVVNDSGSPFFCRFSKLMPVFRLRISVFGFY